MVLIGGAVPGETEVSSQWIRILIENDWPDHDFIRDHTQPDGSNIGAQLTELFAYLDAPVRRVAALDTPVAYAPDLEEEILPQPADILDAIRATAKF